VYFIAIPVILGLTIGFFLLTNDNNIDQEPAIFTKDKLLENSPPIIGDKTAKITILEFGDYQCTFCHKFHQQTFGEIKKSYIDTGKVNFTYKDLPVNGMASVLAAEASFCAEDQNKYWEYHNMLFDNWAGERTGWVTENSLLNFAKEANLNIEEFAECIQSHKYNHKVIENEKFAKSVGINATPSFLIFSDEKLVRIIGAQQFEKFEDAINQIS
tara:strand:+ start:2815 stop:3456 length:642 start_codon:yes stop_codon:yes gene_type:complete